VTQFRLIALAGTALLAVWAGAALAQRPQAEVVRLDPGYGGVCEACDLSGRVLAGARMSNSIFDRSDFSRAVLTRVDATGSRFEHCDFSSADLSHAKLVRARLNGARFNGAILSGADLREAEGLTQRQLDHACGDADTRLPRGLRVRSCD
jgi:uncharacterized protein YjbI with pentapeptide repeats